MSSERDKVTPEVKPIRLHNYLIVLIKGVTGVELFASDDVRSRDDNFASVTLIAYRNALLIGNVAFHSYFLINYSYSEIINLYQLNDFKRLADTMDLIGRSIYFPLIHIKFLLMCYHHGSSWVTIWNVMQQFPSHIKVNSTFYGKVDWISLFGCFLIVTVNYTVLN